MNLMDMIGMGMGAAGGAAIGGLAGAPLLGAGIGIGLARPLLQGFQGQRDSAQVNSQARRGYGAILSHTGGQPGGATMIPAHKQPNLLDMIKGIGR